MSTPTPIRVMLVDDSAVVRGLMTRALQEEPGIEIAASASTGAMAISMLKQQKIDVIILDIEMPEMDGITALPQLLALSPATRIVMASSLTSKGADISMKALSLGASDYLPKPSSREPEAVQAFYRELIAKVKALGASKPVAAPKPAALSPVPAAAPSVDLHSRPPSIRALAIASSTGGPQALMALFTALKGKALPVPVFITQHMPATFTTILAEHLAKASGHPCVEAKDGQEVAPGVIYIAPGDYHMLAERREKPVLRITQDPPVNYCRPAADPMFTSLAAIYGRHLLVLVLTGMGHDGLEGAREVVKAGGVLVAQDEASSVVWGMPRAVAEANIGALVLPLKEIAPYLIRVFERALP